ncbi:MAG: oxidoreductase [Gemmatimonadetes bacterium]|jgi:predicted dehydrogenase|nr:oxidoreductase [Gemmatimonadota bacterium]
MAVKGPLGTKKKKASVKPRASSAKRGGRSVRGATTAGPIRVGILGQGRSGLDIHARFFTRSPRHYRIAAISDLLRERRTRAESELGCDTYRDYRQLLARDDIDLVVNSLPSHLHPAVTAEALSAGHHVVCEKPLAWKVADVDRVIDAARAARRILAPFQQSRYSPDFQKILQVIDSGVLGEIVQIKISANGFARRWDWQTLQEFRGGNLLNTGPHFVDQAVCLMGFRQPKVAFCHMGRANTYGDAEDDFRAILQRRNAPTIDLEISSCCAYSGDTYIVNGTHGGLSGGGGGLRWRYFDPKKAPGQKLIRAPLPGPSYCRENLTFTERTWSPNEAQRDRFSFMSKRFYDHLFKVLRKGAPLDITPRQVRVQVGVMEECHRRCPLPKLPPRGWRKGG